MARSTGIRREATIPARSHQMITPAIGILFPAIAGGIQLRLTGSNLLVEEVSRLEEISMCLLYGAPFSQMFYSGINANREQLFLCESVANQTDTDQRAR